MNKTTSPNWRHTVGFGIPFRGSSTSPALLVLPLEFTSPSPPLTVGTPHAFAVKPPEDEQQTVSASYLAPLLFSLNTELIRVTNRLSSEWSVAEAPSAVHRGGQGNPRLCSQDNMWCTGSVKGGDKVNAFNDVSPVVWTRWTAWEELRWRLHRRIFGCTRCLKTVSSTLPERVSTCTC